MFVNGPTAGLDIARRHQMPWADFDGLARGNGGAGAVSRLRSVLRSRRLAQLRALIEDISAGPALRGPLPNLDAAWSLLARVEKNAPSAFEVIIGHPYTGTWLTHTRRLISGATVESDCPIWIHVGHLHALAAAAAIMAGIEFETRIPVRDGEAILPTLGTARLSASDRWSTADIQAGGDGVRVSGQADMVLPPDTSEDAPGWWAMRRLKTRGEMHQLEIRLDDLDPYRDLRTVVPAERLDKTEVDIWDHLLNDAWRLMVECVPVFAEGFAVGFDSLVARPVAPFQHLSGSVSEAFGSAVIARPPSAMLLASTLVHEFQHSLLHGLTQLTRLYEEDPAQRFYAPWRDDPRPLAGTMHGIYAFFGMTRFWQSLARRQNSRRAWFELAHCHRQTQNTLKALRSDPKLTQNGRRLLDGVAEHLGEWHQKAIPNDIASLAEKACTDHYAGWRLRHLRPPSATVEQLTNAWLSGDHPTLASPANQPPVSEPDGSWTGARLELIRLRLEDPQRFDQVWHTVPGATSADFAYVSGKVEEAIWRYRRDLESDPDSVTAWTGLGLALAEKQPSSLAARSLLGCPELVRAVARAVRSRAAMVPAPAELAAWIARCVGLER